MPRPRALSSQAQALLIALVRARRDWRYGYDLAREIGLNSGSLYPILMRLSERGLLETDWEDSEHPGRPRRHIYRLTAQGAALATNIARESARGRLRVRHATS